MRPIAFSSMRRARTLLPLLAIATAFGVGGAVLAQDDGGAVEAMDSSGSFEVAGVEVDVVGRNASEARDVAYKEAMRRGWRMLYGRMTGSGEQAAPRLPDSALDAMVSGIIVEHEDVGPKRYVGRLGVLFDRARAGSLLGVHGQVMRSPPMLFIPVEIQGSAARTVGANTAWHRAWARFRAGASPIDYIRPSGAGADPLLMSWGQTRRGNRAWWTAILEQYGALDVLSAEARLDRAWPGGPVTGHFTARHGPDGLVIGRFSLRVADSTQLDRMLDQAVQRVDGLYAGALRDGRLKPDPSLKIEELPSLEDIAPIVDTGVVETAGGLFEIEIDTPDSAAFNAMDQLLRTTQGVSGTRMSSLSLGGMSRVQVNYAGTIVGLRYRLDQRGWRLEPAGSGYRLRRRADGEAPLPMPPELMAPPPVSQPGAAPAAGGAPGAGTPAPAPAPARPNG